MNYFSKGLRPLGAAVFMLCMGAGSGPVLTQTLAKAQANAVTLAQALQAAWALSAPSRSLANRRGEFEARGRAAEGWFSGEAVATLAHRTDRLSSNGGLREYEAELEAPLWMPGVRRATLAKTAAEQRSFESLNTTARLKLAGELRVSAGAWHLAQAERDVAQAKLKEAQVLASDVARRVKAGDTARVDSLQAQAAVQLADGALALAEGALAARQAEWRGLTGLEAVASLNEAPPNVPGSDAQPSQSHPLALAAAAQVLAAQSKLDLLDADQRDPMAVSVGVTRERSAFGAASDTSLRLALKIPLGGEHRNAPRKAAALAELDTAQAEADAALRQIGAEMAAANAELAAARSAQSVAAERTALTAQAHTLIAKSFALGQSDLPTRLRADNEKFDAERALARARIEVQRAVSRLNQALGLLP